jgi:hypothetical protein
LAHHGLASRKEPAACPNRSADAVTLMHWESTGSGGVLQGSGTHVRGGSGDPPRKPVSSAVLLETISELWHARPRACE